LVHKNIFIRTHAHLLEMSVAVIIGRFQPPHLGHVYMIKRLLVQYKDIYIFVPSYRKQTSANPLKGKEVKLLLFATLKDAHIDINRVHVTLVRAPKKFQEHPLEFTVLKIRTNVKEPFIIFTGNNVLYRTLRENGINVIYFKRVKIKGNNISGSLIRKKIAQEDDDWKHLLSPRTVLLIKRIGLDKRIKNLMRAIGEA